MLPYLRAIRQRTSLAICSGNHDVLPQRGFDTAQWMQPLRDEGIHIDGDDFWFCDYRFRCIGWCDPVPASQEPWSDFWVMHAPPYGARTSMVRGGISHGDEEARDVCLAGGGPLITLGGHVHWPIEFWDVLHETITLNPGKGDNFECPNHIVVDMTNHRMAHHYDTELGMMQAELKFIA